MVAVAFPCLIRFAQSGGTCLSGIDPALSFPLSSCPVPRPLLPWFVHLRLRPDVISLFTNPISPPKSHTVDIPQELKDSIRKFRFARHKGNAALVVKINRQKLIMEEVDRFDDISLEDLAEGMAAFFYFTRVAPHHYRISSDSTFTMRWQSSQSPRRDTSCYLIISNTKMAESRPPSSSSTGPRRARPAYLPYTQALCWISKTPYARPTCSGLLTDVFYTRWTSPSA